MGVKRESSSCHNEEGDRGAGVLEREGSLHAPSSDRLQWASDREPGEEEAAGDKRTGESEARQQR